MKIAFLSTFFPYRGGIAQFNARLYRLFEKEHEIRAYTFSRQYPDLLFPGKTQLVTPEDHADPVPAERILDTINPLSYRKTAQRIKAFNPDLLIMRLWMPFFAPSLGYIGASLKKRGTKVISILDNVIPHEKRPGDLTLTRYFLKRNDGFIVMCKSVEQELKSFIPEAPAILKPHPVYDHFGDRISKQAAREKLNIPAGKKVLLFFGFIRDYKGMDTLLHAFANLDDSYHLVIAGEVYGSFAKYEQIIAEHNLSPRISLFIQYINDDEVTNFFSASDVAVLPYKSATQSGIVQIAYNFDLPVIVTDVGGLSEMVTDGETGLIVQTENEEQLAASISSYFEQNFEQTFSKRIANHKKEFSWQEFTRAIIKLYQQIH